MSEAVTQTNRLRLSRANQRERAFKPSARDLGVFDQLPIVLEEEKRVETRASDESGQSATDPEVLARTEARDAEPPRDARIETRHLVEVDEDLVRAVEEAVATVGAERLPQRQRRSVTEDPDRQTAHARSIGIAASPLP